MGIYPTQQRKATEKRFFCNTLFLLNVQMSYRCPNACHEKCSYFRRVTQVFAHVCNYVTRL